VVDQPSTSDLYTVLASEDLSQLIEFIEQLQNAVDRSEAEAGRLAARIVKLEADRATLRARLDDTRQQLASIRSHPLGRIASRSTRTVTESDTTPPQHDSAPTPRSENRLCVATILDEISDACWSPEFNNVRLARSSWRAQLESSTPDLLFVESAFAGVDGSWARRVAHFGQAHDDIAELVSTCRDRGIPTVFWNKEDPVNYAWFVGAASLFDHVFTVDGDQIPRYRDQLGHNRIHVLPFAAQPRLHSPPTPGTVRERSLAFAGSYYARKHAERRDQIDMLLVPALEFGLDIYDRMNRSDDERFAWPERFRSSIVGAVPYAEMGNVYRRYKVFLNVNTVTGSPTMCARRVFELAATGTPVVSGPSEAIEAMVPREVAYIARSTGTARDLISGLLDDPDGQAKASVVGPQWVRESHTYAHRLETILEIAAPSIAAKSSTW